MAVSLYMDVHIPKAITLELRMRGVDIVTSQEDDTTRLADPELLDRATGLQRVLFTFDDDLLKEAKRCQVNSIAFAGVIYARLLDISIGDAVRDLEIIAKAAQAEDMLNRVEYLPL
jgi:predicted nuclease of predicted toxin-antitoxin system